MQLIFVRIEKVLLRRSTDFQEVTLYKDGFVEHSTPVERICDHCKLNLKEMKRIRMLQMCFCNRKF